MTTRHFYYLAFTCALAGGLIGTATASACARPYGALRAGLLASSVQVLLPVPIPRWLKPARSIAIISADRNGYYVGFSTVAGCAGALACATFHVSGYPIGASVARDHDAGLPIRLPDRSMGIYQPRDCSGASCTEASLQFKRGRTRYELDAQSGQDNLKHLLEAYRSLRPLFTP